MIIELIYNWFDDKKSAQTNVNAYRRKTPNFYLKNASKLHYFLFKWLKNVYFCSIETTDHDYDDKNYVRLKWQNKCNALCNFYMHLKYKGFEPEW